VPFQKYLTEKNLFILSGIIVVFWMIFDPHWEAMAVFAATCAAIKGISMAQNTKEREELTKEFESYSDEIRNSLAYLVDVHLVDQDIDNQKERISKMWQEHGQGNKDVFIDYIIHSLMTHNSERCQFQVFNIVNTDGMITAQLVQAIDRFLVKAKQYGLEDHIKSTKLYDLYQWLTHTQYKEFRRRAYWPFYV